MNETGSTNKKKNVAVQEDTPLITFLLPCCNTPLLTSDFLYVASESKMFDKCAFALLLDAFDPSLAIYKELINKVRNLGLNVGYFIFDGTPYIGKINKAAMIIDTVSLCVLDNKHLPAVVSESKTKSIYEHIIGWLSHSAEPMKVGLFGQSMEFPIVTKKFIERIGYMFHTLSFGRKESEVWLLQLAQELEILSVIPDCQIIETSAKTFELEGFSTEDDQRWVVDALMHTIDDVSKQIEFYKVK